MNNERRLVGIDLGISAAHTVRVLRGDGSEVCRRRCWPTRDSLQEIERTALSGAPRETRLEVVIEPTGPAWLPIAIYFCGRGHAVHRVSSAKAAALRRFLSRHAKSNGIDAETLAKLPIIDPGGLLPLELPDQARASLDRRARASDRLVELAAAHKVRIRDLVRQLLPMTPLGRHVSTSDLAVLERTGADPRRLLEIGLAGLTDLIVEASRGHHDVRRAQAWLDAAQDALELYGEHPAMPYDDLAAEIRSEVRLLHAIESELPEHAAARETAYQQTDPRQLARSLPGLCEIGAPTAVAFLGRPQRFGDAAHFRSFTGLTPKASETGETDRKGQAISKAGPGRLRTTFVRAANTARTIDPQLARLYYLQMVERGANHLKALCVVAAELAERFWLVMERGTPYELRDTDGRPISKAEGRAIVAATWKVSDEVRRRRRSRKGGKAPQQVHSGRATTSAQGATTRRPSPSPIVPPGLTPIKKLLEHMREETNVPG
jgi:transposase